MKQAEGKRYKTGGFYCQSSEINNGFLRASWRHSDTALLHAAYTVRRRGSIS
jgi:hypothetical protein